MKKNDELPLSSDPDLYKNPHQIDPARPLSLSPDPTESESLSWKRWKRNRSKEERKLRGIPQCTAYFIEDTFVACGRNLLPPQANRFELFAPNGFTKEFSSQLEAEAWLSDLLIPISEKGK